LPEPGELDNLLDLIEDPQALAQLAAASNQPRSAGSVVTQPLAKGAEDQKILEDLVGQPSSSVGVEIGKRPEDQKIPEDLVVAPGPTAARAARRTIPPLGPGKDSARRRRSEDPEDQKILKNSALGKLQRAARLATVPRADGVLPVQAGRIIP